MAFEAAVGRETVCPSGVGVGERARRVLTSTVDWLEYMWEY